MFETHKIDTFFSGEKNVFDEDEINFISRRTKIVRFFKLFLPSLTALLLGLGVVLFDFNSPQETTLTMADDEKIYFEKFRIKNTVFEITEKDNQLSIIKADIVEEPIPGKKIYNLINPDAVTYDKDKTITLKSKTGAFNQNNHVLDLKEDVVANYNKEMVINTSSATYNFKTEQGYGKEKISGSGSKGNFTANSFSFDKKVGSITLIGDVILNSGDMKLVTPKDATLFTNDNKFVATNATATKAKDSIKGDTLTVFFKDTKNFEIKKALSSGNTELYSGGKKAYADKGEYLAIDNIVNLYGNVKIVDARGYTATAKKGIFDNNKKTFTLLEDVKITQGSSTVLTPKAVYFQTKDEFRFYDGVTITQEDTKATAETGVYFTKKNIAELEKNVVIIKSGNMVKGDKAVSDFNTSKSRLIAGNGKRISGKLIENNLKDKKD